MTLEEKAAICTGATVWTTTPVDRLGIREIVLSDGPHGLRQVTDPALMSFDALPSTCFPSASCSASSWDPGLLSEMSGAIADEARSAGVDVVLGPGVNIKRSPVGGRNFEYFSEDPFLAGELAVRYIEGMQARGVGSSLKHFAVNNLETRRMTVDAIVDERALREIYLPAFEAAVTRARPWTVMSAYNRVNGTYASQHRGLLIQILREEWGFDGVVVSDWGGVQDRVAAIAGGTDLEMPGPRPRRVREVVAAVREGRLAEAELDVAVRRIVELAARGREPVEPTEWTLAAHHDLARRLAAESMVLLRNDGILPLRDLSSLAVIGRAAVEPRYQGDGSSRVHAVTVDEPLEELRRRDPNLRIDYAEGYPADERDDPAMIAEAVAVSRSTDAAIIFAALPGWKDVEGADRDDLDLTPHQVALIRAVTEVQPRTIVILNNGSAVAMDDWIAGTAAVLEAWLPGEGGGSAIADIIFGVVNPSGKLPETFPHRLADTPAFFNQPGENDEVRYGEGIFVGYRAYDAQDRPVLFPFGHGLSYTDFAYGPPGASSSVIGPEDGVTISVEVTNSGARAGREIVQVYVADRESSLRRPPKELKGFAKVELAPGESKQVEIQLPARSFAFYHPGRGDWVVEAGDFDVLVGSSSADIRGTCTVTVRSGERRPSLLGDLSTLGDWLADPAGREILAPMLPSIQDRLVSALGSAPNDPAAVDPDIWWWVTSMPLLYVLDVGAGPDGAPPTEVVGTLLAQVRQATTVE
jgi:beta-glucosidase